MSDEPSEQIWSTEAWDSAPSGLPELDAVLMRLLLEHISTRVAVVGTDRRYLYANQETLRFMGRTAEEVIGRHMSEVLDPGIYATISPYFDRAFAGEQLRRRAWAHYARQGKRFREQWYVPYRPNGGPVEAVVVCGLDQTEQRLGEAELAMKSAALRTSEALKSAIFDHALVAFVATDADGLIVEFNPAAEAIFGRARDAVLGVPVSEVMIPERFRAAHEEGMRRMRDREPSRVLGRRLEMHATHADGSEFPMEMVLWRTDAEGATFYTASISDLSQRHGAAQQIERQREALRQSEKLTAMGSLLAGVSHELNNPLAIVMGRASLLEEKSQDLPAFLDDARRIREAAERCGRIVRTFLNMARSRPARRERASLNEAARAAIDMLGYSYRSHDIELEIDLAADLPEVSADVDQLCQIALNLLVNAQQSLALHVGVRRVAITTGVGRRGDEGSPDVWLRVADNGPGVPAEVQARLFEPFFTTKAEGLGTGMGLSVSRTLAREHGGDLVHEAVRLAEGASFCLTLPVALKTGDAAADLSGAAADTPMLGRVLVVDDEAELVQVMREMLESAGYEVAVAESGAVALALLGTARFDIIVCDLRMPDMDGASLWRAVRSANPSLARRLLFVTGDTLSQDAVALFRASGCDGLDKPFTKAELLERVAALLRQTITGDRS